MVRLRSILIAVLLLTACSQAGPAARVTPQAVASPTSASLAAAATPTQESSGPTAAPSASPTVNEATATPEAMPAATPVPSPVPSAIPTPASVQAATATPEPSRLSTVRAAFNILMDKYYRPLSSSDLLSAAWLGVSDQARSSGASDNLSAPKFTGDRAQDLKLFGDRYSALVSSNPRLDPVRLSFAAVQSMAGSLEDDHTAFLSPQVNAQFQEQSAGGTKTVGIGVTLDSARAPFVIQEVVPGAPADQAGVKAGDAIISVDSQDVSQATLTKLTGLLRGEAGTKVTLVLKRPSSPNVTVTITRAAFVTPVLQSRITTNGVGVLKLRQFPETYIKFSDGKTFQEELDADLQAFEQAGVKNWVVDLRDNPGGSVSSLAELAGRFVPDGLVVVSVGRAQDRQETPVDGHLFPVQRPLAVLINRGSASSSELFASAVHDYKRGLLVGEPTAGAVNASEEFPLSDGAAIQVTVAQALTGKGEKPLDGTGVKPDVAVSEGVLTPDDLAKGRDPQLERAVSALQGQGGKALMMSATPVPPVALPASQIRATLSPLGASESMLPPGPDQHLAGSQVIDTANEFVSGAENVATLRAKVAQRGWQGTLQQFFGSHDPPTYTVELDLYAAATGAKDAVSTNDYPKQFQAVQAPITLGDDTVAYKGINSSLGSVFLAWRHGRVVLNVSYFGQPGSESFDPLVSIAKALDSQYQQHPIT